MSQPCREVTGDDWILLTDLDLSLNICHRQNVRRCQDANFLVAGEGLKCSPKGIADIAPPKTLTTSLFYCFRASNQFRRDFVRLAEDVPLSDVPLNAELQIFRQSHIHDEDLNEDLRLRLVKLLNKGFNGAESSGWRCHDNCVGSVVSGDGHILQVLQRTEPLRVACKGEEQKARWSALLLEYRGDSLGEGLSVNILDSVSFHEPTQVGRLVQLGNQLLKNGHIGIGRGYDDSVSAWVCDNDILLEPQPLLLP